jgi:hypothetical protein
MRSAWFWQSISKREITVLVRKLMLLAATSNLATITFQPSPAQPGRWIYLGEANVDGGSDHDRIKVGGGRGNFRALQIGVERAAIVFFDSSR